MARIEVDYQKLIGILANAKEIKHSHGAWSYDEETISYERALDILNSKYYPTRPDIYDRGNYILIKTYTNGDMF